MITCTAAFAPEPVTQPAAREHNVAIGYLRAFVTVLVVAHHAALAYISFAPPPPASLAAQPRWWLAFPVADTRRWGGFDVFVGFNDVFFMSLMFFLSGLFVWKSLERKGARTFLRDRLLRLGVPFLAAAAVIAPLAYYPAYLQCGSRAGYLKEWLSLGYWPAGPAWFIWVLLAFDCVAAGLYLIWRPKGHASCATGRPLAFFGFLIGFSAATYLPMAIAYGSLSWTVIGPFTFQTSRIFHYAFYFLIAVAAGAWGIDRGLLSPGGNLARRWPRWVLTALAAFALAAVAAIGAASSQNAQQAWTMLAHCGFIVSCAASSFAFLALFARFSRTRRKILDSLRDNAYGMYLIHYAFVSWLQYSLVDAPLHGLAKGMIVFAGAVALSWGATAAIRRIPAVARVI